MSWTPDASELKKPHRSAIKGRRENEKTKTLQSPPRNVFLRATTPGTDHRQLAGAKKLARWVRNTLKKKRTRKISDEIALPVPSLMPTAPRLLRANIGGVGCTERKPR